MELKESYETKEGFTKTREMLLRMEERFDLKAYCILAEKVIRMRVVINEAQPRLVRDSCQVEL